MFRENKQNQHIKLYSKVVLQVSDRPPSLYFPHKHPIQTTEQEQARCGINVVCDRRREHSYEIYKAGRAENELRRYCDRDRASIGPQAMHNKFERECVNKQ